MAVPVRRVQQDPAWQAPQFRQNGVYPRPVIQVEERQPELSPARNAQNSLGPYEAPGRLDQGIALLDTEQSRRDVDQCGDEQVRRRVLVQAPRAVFESGPFEGTQHTPASAGIELPPDDVVQQHILRRQHGAPNHFAFPGAVLSLEPQQARGRGLQRRPGIGRFDFFRTDRSGRFTFRTYGARERGGRG